MIELGALATVAVDWISFLTEMGMKLLSSRERYVDLIVASPPRRQRDDGLSALVVEHLDPAFEVPPSRRRDDCRAAVVVEVGVVVVYAFVSTAVFFSLLDMSFREGRGDRTRTN